MKSFFTGIVVCAILFAAGYLGYPFLESSIIQKPVVVVNKPKVEKPKKIKKEELKIVKKEEPKVEKPAPKPKKTDFVYLDKIPLFGMTESGKPKTLEPLFIGLSKEISDEEIIALITAESSNVAAFQGNEIQDFAVDEPFIFEEKIYQVGLVTYRKQGGIFGTQTVKAKALIRDGAITSWLNYSTNTPL